MKSLLRLFMALMCLFPMSTFAEDVFTELYEQLPDETYQTYPEFIDALIGRNSKTDQGPRVAQALNVSSRALPQDYVSLELPRVIQAIDLPDRPFPQLFIGYTPGADELEIISWNETEQKFDFLIVSDFTPTKGQGIRPKQVATVTKQDDSKCVLCHQHGGPIFSHFPWSESIDQTVDFGGVRHAEEFKNVEDLSEREQYLRDFAGYSDILDSAPFNIDVSVRSAATGMQALRVCPLLCQEGDQACRNKMEFLSKNLIRRAGTNQEKNIVDFIERHFASKISGLDFAYPSSVLLNRAAKFQAYQTGANVIYHPMGAALPDEIISFHRDTLQYNPTVAPNYLDPAGYADVTANFENISQEQIPYSILGEQSHLVDPSHPRPKVNPLNAENLSLWRSVLLQCILFGEQVFLNDDFTPSDELFAYVNNPSFNWNQEAKTLFEELETKVNHNPSFVTSSLDRSASFHGMFINSDSREALEDECSKICERSGLSGPEKKRCLHNILQLSMLGLRPSSIPLKAELLLDEHAPQLLMNSFDDFFQSEDFENMKQRLGPLSNNETPSDYVYLAAIAGECRDVLAPGSETSLNTLQLPWDLVVQDLWEPSLFDDMPTPFDPREFERIINNQFYLAYNRDGFSSSGTCRKVEAPQFAEIIELRDDMGDVAKELEEQIEPRVATGDEALALNILHQQCYRCHGPDRMMPLPIDNLEALRNIRPDRQNYVWRKINPYSLLAADEGSKMPVGGELSTAELEVLEQFLNVPEN
jgi:hypothetical protein